MNDAQQTRGTFTGRHMWMLAIGFFGVIISVNIVLAVFATTSWTGLVVDNTYVASQQFEGKRMAHERQQEAGWQAKFTFANGMAVMTVVDATDKPVELGLVALKVNRPVGGHDDQAVTLERTATGEYSARLDLAAGVWEARATALQTPLGRFELHERFKVEEAGQ